MEVRGAKIWVMIKQNELWTVGVSAVTSMLAYCQLDSLGTKFGKNTITTEIF